MLPPLDRLPGVMRLVERGEYFVIHAARQSGKTTALQQLVRDVNAAGDCLALYFTLETLQGISDASVGLPRMVEKMRSDLLWHPLLAPVMRGSAGDGEKTVCALSDVKLFLSRLARSVDKPLVVLFDEVDAMCGATLVAFLRELRSGYITRETIPFPHAVALVGMRDIRDYRAQIRPDAQTLGSQSPFNVVSEDFAMRDFTETEVAALYAQHTEATGQLFAEDAVAEAYRVTGGQPWLVNALARECVEKIHAFRYDAVITKNDIETAKETIIRRRDTHVDSLMERLKEDRVRKVVEPVILGKDSFSSGFNDDYRYVIDLGLLKENESQALVPANPMYAEIIIRYLTGAEQKRFYEGYGKPFWLKPDGSLDVPALMTEFQRFWRENSEADREVYGYKEATPHLVLMAFLQRVVNGGGRITREMALGSGRLDLCVEYNGFRYAVELKMRRNFSREKSFAQFSGYLDRLGLKEGWMPVFDDGNSKPWEDRLFLQDEELDGKRIHVVGL